MSGTDPLVCPFCGSDNLGTNETIGGTAYATLYADEKGNVEVEHHGETRVDWDSSTTDEVNPYVCVSCWRPFSDKDLSVQLALQPEAT
jgi:hypothetical protein